LDQEVGVAEEPKIPDFVVFDGRDMSKVVFVMRRLASAKSLYPSEMQGLAEALKAFLSEGVEVTAEQLRKGTK
jgi:hypothetical protein